MPMMPPNYGRPGTGSSFMGGAPSNANAMKSNMSGGQASSGMPRNYMTMPYQSPSTPPPTNVNGISGAFQGVNPARAGYDVGTASIMANQAPSQMGNQGLMASLNTGDQAPAQYMRGMLDGLRAPPNAYGQQQAQGAYNPYASGQGYGPLPFPGPFPDLASTGPFSGMQYTGYKKGGHVKSKNKNTAGGNTSGGNTSGGSANSDTRYSGNPYGNPPAATIPIPSDMVFASDLVPTQYGFFSRGDAYSRGLLPGQANYVPPSEWSARLGVDPVTMFPISAPPTTLSPTAGFNLANLATADLSQFDRNPNTGFMSVVSDTAAPTTTATEPIGYADSFLQAGPGLDAVNRAAAEDEQVRLGLVVDTPYGRMPIEEARLKGLDPETVAARNALSDQRMAAQLREMDAQLAANAAARGPVVDDRERDNRGVRDVYQRPITPLATYAPQSYASRGPKYTPPVTTPSPSSVPSEASTPSTPSFGADSFRNFLTSRATPAATTTPAASTTPYSGRPMFGSGVAKMNQGLASLGPRAAGFNR